MRRTLRFAFVSAVPMIAAASGALLAQPKPLQAPFEDVPLTEVKRAPVRRAPRSRLPCGARSSPRAGKSSRADTVRGWLVAHGVAMKLSARGWGKTRPVAPNAFPDGRDDPEGRAKNRRPTGTSSRPARSHARVRSALERA